jgi:hypothetical protein
MIKVPLTIARDMINNIHAHFEKITSQLIEVCFCLSDPTFVTILQSVKLNLLIIL